MDGAYGLTEDYGFGPVWEVVENSNNEHFQDKNHAGFTGIRDGIHFITLKGMVNHPQENSYAVAHVYADHIVVEGIGAEDTRIIPIRGVFGEKPNVK